MLFLNLFFISIVGISDAATLPNFEIRGMSFLATVDSVKDILNIRCERDDKAPIGVICIDKTRGGSSKNSCWKPKHGLDDFVCNQSDKPISEVPIDIYYRIITNRVGRVDFSFPAEGFQLIRGAFESKYGKPAKVTSKEVQTRLGAKYTNIIIQWHFKEGTLFLRKYDGKISEGGGKIVSKRYEKEFSDRVARKKKDAANDL